MATPTHIRPHLALPSVSTHVRGTIHGNGLPKSTRGRKEPLASSGGSLGIPLKPLWRMAAIECQLSDHSEISWADPQQSRLRIDLIIHF